MMKLFGSFGPATKKSPTHEADIRYTRFSYHKTREVAAPQSHDHPSHVRRPAAPAAAHRPASNVARAKPAKLDENAHLYSEARVSIAVLRNALPQRFAKLT